MKRFAPLFALLLGGCYQSIGAGYSYRFASEGGNTVEGQWLIGVGEILGDDEPAAYAKVSFGGGSWGFRGADVVGVMVQQDLDAARFFLRPGLAFLVLGTEARNEDRVWVGAGAELEMGLLVPTGDDAGLEIGVRGGGDLSYLGFGSGGFLGVFIAFGWVTGGPDFFSN